MHKKETRKEKFTQEKGDYQWTHSSDLKYQLICYLIEFLTLKIRSLLRGSHIILLMQESQKS